MKKYMFLFILVLSVFFTGFGDVNAADCNDGVVCHYSFCGMRDATQASNGLLAQSCPQAVGQVKLDIVFRCKNNDKSASECTTFESWAYAFKNSGGGAKELTSWGNYDFLFKDTDKYLKQLFSEQGKFTCPTILVSLKDSTNDDKYTYGYARPSNYDFSQSSVEGVQNNTIWSSMPSGRRVTGSAECINGSTDLSAIKKKTSGESDSAITDATEETIENNNKILAGQGDRTPLDIDCSDEKNKNSIICAIYEWGGLDDSTRFDSSNVDPCSLIGGETQKLLHQVFLFISIAGVIILVVMTAISLIKVITASEDNALSNFLKGFWKRIICLIILLLLPTIITFLIQVVNGVGVAWNINSDNPLCDVTK